MLNDWLKTAISASGLKQVEVSRLLTEAVGRSVDAAAIGKLIRGERKLYADELVEIARICKYPLPISADGQTDKISEIAAAFDYMERAHDSRFGTVDVNLNTALLLANGSAKIEPLSVETLRRRLIVCLMQAGLNNPPDQVWKAVDALLIQLKMNTKTLLDMSSLIKNGEVKPSGTRSSGQHDEEKL